LPEGLPHRRIIKDADPRDFGRLLPPRALHLEREQQTAAPDQSNELASVYVEHGDFLPYAYQAPTGPFGRFTARSACFRAECRSLGQT
jgi:hypothetical protein